MVAVDGLLLELCDRVLWHTSLLFTYKFKNISEFCNSFTNEMTAFVKV